MLPLYKIQEVTSKDFIQQLTRLLREVNSILTNQIDFKNLGLRRELFWDINEVDIDKTLIESDEWVIVRVFEYGNLEEIAAVIHLYGERNSKEILKLLSLRPMARSMAKLFLDIDTNTKEERPLYFK